MTPLVILTNVSVVYITYIISLKLQVNLQCEPPIQHADHQSCRFSHQVLNSAGDASASKVPGQPSLATYLGPTGWCVVWLVLAPSWLLLSSASALACTLATVSIAVWRIRPRSSSELVLVQLTFPSSLSLHSLERSNLI